MNFSCNCNIFSFCDFQIFVNYQMKLFTNIYLKIHVNDFKKLLTYVNACTFFSKGQGQLWPTFLMWRHAWKHWVNLWWTSLHWMTYQKQTVVWCLYSAPKKFQRLFSRICAKVLKIKSNQSHFYEMIIKVKT